jgi:hypothetical protein
MVFQFLVGCIVSVINIMIHALVTVGAVGIATRWKSSFGRWPMRSSARRLPAAICSISPSSTTPHSGTEISRLCRCGG